MSRLLRYYHPGQVYFITSVTHNRIPILVDNAELFHRAIDHVRNHTRFAMLAWVLMPDHFHAIIDPGEANLSSVVGRIKQSFAMRYLKTRGRNHGRAWQRRFWDHVIRDERDLHRHIDYVHYNPIKHGLVREASRWPHSSFVDYVDRGFYRSDWGCAGSAFDDFDFGE